MKRAGLFIVLCGLGACAALPGSFLHKKDQGSVAFPVKADAPELWAAAGVMGSLPESDWLDQFNDGKLKAFVEEALTANPSLKSQFHAVEAVRAQTRRVYGGSLPDVSVSASAGQTSTYVEPRSSRVSSPTFGVVADLSWEIDFWGRVRSGIDAAKTDLIVSEASFAAAQLSTAAQTAIAWLDLNESLAQERLAVENHKARAYALELTERRLSRGANTTTALDVRIARTAKDSAAAAISARQLARGNAVRRLEILLGRYPGAALSVSGQITPLEPIRMAGNPALLLSRRPDIVAAEARVVAAGLRAEQARLALFPGFRLTGRASTNADNLSSALDPSRIAASLVAGLSAPVFNGGVLRADRDAAVARAQGAVENYAAAALTAWREVEDALAADGLLARQENSHIRALDEAIQAEELATRRYTNGLINIFNLIDAQTRRINAESSIISTRASRATNRVRFHLALGGGLPVGIAVPAKRGDVNNSSSSTVTTKPEGGISP